MGVIQFQRPEPLNPHMSGEAVCAACGKNWVAVVPVGVPLFECPECHTEKGRFKYSCVPAEDSHVWACACGCDLFRVTDKEALCINCGMRQEFP